MVRYGFERMHYEFVHGWTSSSETARHVLEQLTICEFLRCIYGRFMRGAAPSHTSLALVRPWRLRILVFHNLSFLANAT